MMNPSFSESLAKSAFSHRATSNPDGSVVYRLADGTGFVRVQHSEWRRLSEDFSQSMAPIRRRTRLLTAALFPAILLFGMTLGQILPYSGLIILTAIFLGPLAIYLWHSKRVQMFSGQVERALAAKPRCAPAAQTSPREARWFEIAFLVLVGPHLLIAIIGEVGGPDIFRGTPLSGSRIGPAEIVGFMCIVARFIMPSIGRLWAARTVGEA